ncbi:DNA-binding transcriptional LysR family regulator [Actinoplanes lutulentus]|uniref:DNA-binding transcriptional LysR family regulator n=1 Tax=Actinoplanes lutulentus TaxID=1287878 RepID=A0A327Z577_9ACTN|nr:LysR substrate-binding domain-containing protein [Actinoplanes lutulentus]MBB2947766.1 DNA-binding transcriptional LysR family regulator [Actinoplanes lutulentus]RAK29920.1 DNA-binding transcriptional LysR family regulator [Actinoplanes lutulentus]
MNSIDAAITAVDDLAALDLNMLTALRALLQERGVTRAGARLGLGQPATSAALRRLRQHFDDPLLVRTGTVYELSPLAAVLLGAVEEALAAAESVFLGAHGFRPAASHRTFTVMASDGSLALLGAALLPRFAALPLLRLEFVPLVLDDVDATLRAVDAVVMPRGIFAGHPAADLWSDEFVLVVGERSALRAGDVTPERLSAMEWVSSFHGPSVLTTLESWGIRPRVQVVVPSYLAIPLLLAGSERHVALLQRRVAEQMRAVGGVRILPAPEGAREIRMALWWHASRERDPAHLWFREMVIDSLMQPF